MRIRVTRSAAMVMAIVITACGRTPHVSGLATDPTSWACRPRSWGAAGVRMAAIAAASSWASGACSPDTVLAASPFGDTRVELRASLGIAGIFPYGRLRDPSWLVVGNSAIPVPNGIAGSNPLRATVSPGVAGAARGEPSIITASVTACGNAECGGAQTLAFLGPDARRVVVVPWWDVMVGVADSVLSEVPPAARCPGEVHVAYDDGHYSARLEGDSVTVVRWDSTSGIVSSPGWSDAALGVFENRAGPAVMTFEVSSNRIRQTIRVNERFNLTGAPPLACVADLPTPTEAHAVVDFRCDDGTELRGGSVTFDAAANAWVYHDSGAAPLRLTRRPSAPNADAEPCSRDAAARAVRDAARAQTVPFAEIDRKTRWTPAGPCSWLVAGIVIWIDPLTNQPTMQGFGAAVARSGNRYGVDAFHFTGVP
jgi:hypothetical protein